MRNNNISPINMFCRVIYEVKEMNAGKNKDKIATAHCKLCSDRPRKNKEAIPKKNLILKRDTKCTN